MERWDGPAGLTPTDVFEAAAVRAVRFLEERARRDAGDVDAALEAANLRAALLGAARLRSHRERLELALDQQDLFSAPAQRPPEPIEPRLRQAREEAARRNARDFGTDPSWYGVKP